MWVQRNRGVTTPPLQDSECCVPAKSATAVRALPWVYGEMSFCVALFLQGSMARSIPEPLAYFTLPSASSSLQQSCTFFHVWHYL